MMNLNQFNERFGTEEQCREYLVASRWPNGPQCPRCSAPEVAKVSNRWAWQCRKCSPNGYRFSPLVGTIFENTNYALKAWFQVIFFMCQSKKGVSALQIHRMIGSGSYRTAWYMCHRIRAAMNTGTFQALTGQVEVDETYVGGESGNRHISKRPGRVARKDKITVGAIARKGNVVARVIEKADQSTLNAFVDETVSSKVKLVASDEWPGYDRLTKMGFPHETVSHQKGEYVRGQVHTANPDPSWGLLKRGIMGSFHQMSKNYLPFYLAEFTFRHNNRRNADMFETDVAQC